MESFRDKKLLENQLSLPITDEDPKAYLVEDAK